jgi:serine/threonine protein kinase
VEEIIGEGAQGTVLKVTDTTTDKSRVLKCSSSLMEKNVQRLEEDVKIAKIFKFKHLVEYFDSFVEGLNFYIEMEYCSGGDVGRKIAERKAANGQFSKEEIQEILYEAALGIKALHDAKVMHGGIKGRNVLLDSEGHVKIGDFGISRSVDPSNGETSTFIGTPFASFD